MVISSHRIPSCSSSKGPYRVSKGSERQPWWAEWGWAGGDNSTVEGSALGQNSDASSPSKEILRISFPQSVIRPRLAPNPGWELFSPEILLPWAQPNVYTMPAFSSLMWFPLVAHKAGARVIFKQESLLFAEYKLPFQYKKIYTAPSIRFVLETWPPFWGKSILRDWVPWDSSRSAPF